MAKTWHHDFKRYHPWKNPHARHKVMQEFLRQRPYRTCFAYTDYSKSPGWFRNLFNERPNRRITQRLEREAVKGADTEGLMWPLARKPHLYYW